jgi:hypothetical protein
VTFWLIIPIWDIGIPGVIGAVASTVTVPLNVVHCAIPFWSMVTPAGTGMEENGGPMVHIGWGIMAVIGSMLKWPVALNCTVLLLVDDATADEGVTVMLCNCLVFIMLELPQAAKATTIRSRTQEQIKLKGRKDELCRRFIEPPLGSRTVRAQFQLWRASAFLRS